MLFIKLFLICEYEYKYEKTVFIFKIEATPNFKLQCTVNRE